MKLDEYLKKFSGPYCKCPLPKEGFGPSCYVCNQRIYYPGLGKLLQIIEIQARALEFYAAELSWCDETGLCGVVRKICSHISEPDEYVREEDLGDRARQAQKDVEEILK